MQPGAWWLFPQEPRAQGMTANPVTALRAHTMTAYAKTSPIINCSSSVPRYLLSKTFSNLLMYLIFHHNTGDVRHKWNPCHFVDQVAKHLMPWLKSCPWGYTKYQLQTWEASWTQSSSLDHSPGHGLLSSPVRSLLSCCFVHV